jgi:hypothetical protein
MIHGVERDANYIAERIVSGRRHSVSAPVREPEAALAG